MLAPQGIYNPAVDREGRPVFQRANSNYDLAEKVNASDGLRRAGMMFDIERVPLAAEVPGVPGQMGYNLPVAGWVALVREPIESDRQRRVFGVVSDHYEPITPRVMGEVLDPLSRSWPVDSAGGFHAGRDVWLTLRMSPYDVGGDEGERTEFNFFCGNTYGGGGGLVVSTISWRVVCLNTYMAAMNGGSNRLAIPHKGDPELMFRARARMEQIAVERRQQMIATLEAMIKFPVTHEDVAPIIEATFPTPTLPSIFKLVEQPEFAQLEPALKDKLQAKASAARVTYEQSMDVARQRRIGLAEELNKFNDAYPRYARTAYALVNAGTAYADHRAGRNDTVISRRAEQVLSGDRAQEKARTMSAIERLMKLPVSAASVK